MSKPKKTERRRRIRRYTHGGYSYLATGEMPELRLHIKKYLMTVREGLIRDIGPTEGDLTTAQLILVDRTISLLGVTRLIEERAMEDGVFSGKDLSPSLRQSYVSYNNTVRLTLDKLGIDKRKGDRIMTPLQIVEKFDKESKKKETEIGTEQ